MRGITRTEQQQQLTPVRNKSMANLPDSCGTVPANAVCKPLHPLPMPLHYICLQFSLVSSCARQNAGNSKVQQANTSATRARSFVRQDGDGGARGHAARCATHTTDERTSHGYRIVAHVPNHFKSALGAQNMFVMFRKEDACCAAKLFVRAVSAKSHVQLLRCASNPSCIAPTQLGSAGVMGRRKKPTLRRSERTTLSQHAQRTAQRVCGDPYVFCLETSSPLIRARLSGTCVFCASNAPSASGWSDWRAKDRNMTGRRSTRRCVHVPAHVVFLDIVSVFEMASITDA